MARCTGTSPCPVWSGAEGRRNQAFWLCLGRRRGRVIPSFWRVSDWVVMVMVMTMAMMMTAMTNEGGDGRKGEEGEGEAA